MNTAKTKTGLKTATLVEGQGKKPMIGDTVLIHYILYLGNGVSSSNYDYDNGAYIDELVDSTYEKTPVSDGLPIPIIIGKETLQDKLYSTGDSIKGLDEALLDMNLGGKCRVQIPFHLAYGDLGASSFKTFYGYRCPPYKELDMTVELVEIKELGNKNE
tara:strand:- start:590 stop:1066 length:477 start_codon:yes stop_codon:yes gene_type:complete